MKYFLEFCDEISFHFPGVDEKGLPLPDELWQKYHENIKPFLNECLHNGAKKTCTRHYCGAKLGGYSIVIFSKPFHSLKQRLCEEHLFDWSFNNNLPEDVCLYSKKQQRVYSCSHDETFLIYSETDKDKSFLDANGISFLIQK